MKEIFFLIFTLLIGCKQSEYRPEHKVQKQVEREVGNERVSKNVDRAVYIQLLSAEAATVGGVQYGVEDLLDYIRGLEKKPNAKVVIEVKKDALSDPAYDLAFEIEGLGYDRVWVVLLRD